MARIAWRTCSASGVGVADSTKKSMLLMSRNWCSCFSGEIGVLMICISHSCCFAVSM